MRLSGSCFHSYPLLKLRIERFFCRVCHSRRFSPLQQHPLVLVYPILNPQRFSKMRGEIEQDQHSRVLSELSSMIIHILKTPPLPISFPTLLGPAVSSLSYRTSQASPSAFASLFLGISVSLMLFGSVTFVIGLFLMPLVVGLVILFYFVGMIFKLSELGRTILWPGYAPNKDVPAWRFL